MARVRDTAYSENAGNNAVDHVIRMPSNYVVGDYMLLFLAKFADDGTQPVVTGWTQITLPSNAESGRFRYWLYEKTAVASEPNVTVNDGLTAEWISAVIAYEDASGKGTVSHVSSDTAAISATQLFPDVTTSQANVLLQYMGYYNDNVPCYINDGDITLQNAGVSNYSSTTVLGTKSVKDSATLVSDKSTHKGQPEFFVHLVVEVLDDGSQTMGLEFPSLPNRKLDHHVFGVNSTTTDISGLTISKRDPLDFNIPTLFGKNTHAGTTTFNNYAGVFTSQTTYRLQVSTADEYAIFGRNMSDNGSPLDATGKILTGYWGTVNNFYWDKVADQAEKPVVVILWSDNGTTTGSRTFPLWGKDSQFWLPDSAQQYFIDPFSTVETQDDGTFDPTAIVGHGYGVTALTTSTFIVASIVSLDANVPFLGGSSSRPVSLRDVNSHFMSFRNQSVYSLGNKDIYAAQRSIILGDGSADCYFDFEDNAISFPSAYDLNDRASVYCNIRASILEFKIDLTTSSTANLKGLDLSGGQAFKFSVIDNGACAGAEFENMQLTKADPCILEPIAAFHDMLFSQCGLVEAKNCDIRDSTFRDGDAAGAVEISLTTVITGCKFDNSKIVIDTAGTYDVSTCTFVNNTQDIIVTNSSGEVVIQAGSNSITVDDQTTGTGTYSIQAGAAIQITSPQLIDGTRVRMYNNATAAELDNSLVVGIAGYTLNVTIGGSVGVGDVIEMRATYQDGLDAKLPIKLTGTMTSTGLIFDVGQESDTIYVAKAVDGSLQTQFAADPIGLEFDVVLGQNFTAAELYARYVYRIAQADGIVSFFGGLIAENAGNYRNDVSVVSIFLNNNTTTHVYQTDTARIYRSDGARPVRLVTTGGGGIDLNWLSQVFVTSGGGAGTSPWDELVASHQTAATFGELIEDMSTTLSQVDVDATSNQNATVALIGALNDFDPATDTVVNVTNVASNADMRGTDSANTVVPDNTSITTILADTNELQQNQGDWVTATGFSTFDNTTDEVITDTASRIASKADVSALSTFDPASDAVANVTLVDTTTVNSDMRGTDSANTVVPMTAALSQTEHDATQAAIAAGSSAQVIANQEVINQGVKKASLLIPHTTDL